LKKVPPHPSLQHSESQARRSSALESALGPIADFLADERVVEVMLNADGAVWIERHGEGMLRTAVRMAGAQADRMLRLVAAETQCDALDELCRSLLLTLERAVDRDADPSGDTHPDGQARVSAS
jgi:Flp pilus assembly CpaF family ATPase